MEGLGGYRELVSPARGLGSVIFICMVCVTALLERLQFRLRATEASTWWASNGRDVLNAVALGAMSLGLHVLGFTGPISLCIAATLVLVLSVLQTSLGKHRLSGLLSVLAGLLLGAPVLEMPRLVHGVFRKTLEVLFP